MARMIEAYMAVCINAEPVNDEVALRWEPWRKEYIGKQGKLKIYESNTEPGKFQLRFTGGEWSEEIQDIEDWWLMTGSGSITLKDEQLTFESRNSRYVFELKEKLVMWVILGERKEN